MHGEVLTSVGGKEEEEENKKKKIPSKMIFSILSFKFMFSFLLECLALEKLKEVVDLETSKKHKIGSRHSR